MKSLIRLVLIASSSVACATTAMAQSTRDKLSAVESGMNDPSEIVRIATLEDALADDSRAVREYAMSQAFASADKTLRTLAVSQFFSTRSSFSVSVSKSKQLIVDEAEQLSAGGEVNDIRNKASNTYYTLDNYSPAIVYTITAFDDASGALSGYCMIDRVTPDKNYGFVGSLVGNTLAIEHKCDVSSSYSSCRLNMELESDATFRGSMSCRSEKYPPAIALKLR